jgi:hypothetical protein
MSLGNKTPAEYLFQAFPSPMAQAKMPLKNNAGYKPPIPRNSMSDYVSALFFYFLDRREWRS